MKILISQLLLLLFFIPIPSSAEMVDGIAAEVGDRIITVSEVLTEAKIMKILEMEKGTVTIPVVILFDREVLDQMINRELVFREARRLKNYSEGFEILDEVLEFEEMFRDTADFNRFMEIEGLIIDDLSERFIREKTVSAFVAERLSLMATVSGKEVEDYYRGNIDAFTGMEFEDVKDRIRAVLSGKKGEAVLEEWLADLKRRNDVRYFKLPPP